MKKRPQSKAKEKKEPTEIDLGSALAALLTEELNDPEMMVEKVAEE